MAAMPPQVAPAPTAPPPATPAPPPPAPPPMSTLTEKASQLAGSISNQGQFEAALQSAGASNLPAPAKGQLWDTVNKTRVGRGLPPLQVNATNIVGGGQPVNAATQAALPASVTGAAPVAPASSPQVGNKPASTPAPPPSSGNAPAPPPAAKRGAVSPSAVPVYAPPAATATYQTPDLKTATLEKTQYHAPNKGLEYAAMALALLFPGAPIGRAASSFVQGLNTGAQQRFQNDEQQAKEKYEADKAADDTYNQGALTTARMKYDAQRDADTLAGRTYDANFQIRQEMIKQGRNPTTGQPIPPPPQLQRILPPGVNRPVTSADYIAHYQKLSQYYDSIGATDKGTEYRETATQAQAAANESQKLADEIWKTNATIQAGYNRTSATINAANARQEAEFRNGWAMLDARQAQQYRDQATRVNGDANKLWASLTTPITDQYGQTKPPVVDPKSPLYGALTTAMNQMQKGQGRMDPQGYAQYVIDSTPSLKDNPIAQQVLQAKAEALEYTMRSNGYQPVPFIPPPKLDSATILKHAGVNPADPRVQTWRSQATAAGIDPDSPEAVATMKHDLRGAASAATAAKLAAPSGPIGIVDSHTGSAGPMRIPGAVYPGDPGYGHPAPAPTLPPGSEAALARARAIPATQRRAFIQSQPPQVQAFLKQYFPEGQ